MQPPDLTARYRPRGVATASSLFFSLRTHALSRGAVDHTVRERPRVAREVTEQTPSMRESSAAARRASSPHREEESFHDGGTLWCVRSNRASPPPRAPFVCHWRVMSQERLLQWSAAGAAKQAKKPFVLLVQMSRKGVCLQERGANSTDSTGKAELFEIVV